MALTALTTLTLTTRPEALAANTVFTSSGPLLVIDVSTTAATSALLHRWSPEYSRWIPSAAGAATLPGAASVTETRWDIGGINAQYCLLCDAAATHQPTGAQ